MQQIEPRTLESVVGQISSDAPPRSGTITHRCGLSKCARIARACLRGSRVFRFVRFAPFEPAQVRTVRSSSWSHNLFKDEGTWRT